MTAKKDQSKEWMLLRPHQSLVHPSPGCYMCWLMTIYSSFLLWRITFAQRWTALSLYSAYTSRAWPVTDWALAKGYSPCLKMENTPAWNLCSRLSPKDHMEASLWLTPHSRWDYFVPTLPCFPCSPSPGNTSSARILISDAVSQQLFLWSERPS